MSDKLVLIDRLVKFCYLNVNDFIITGSLCDHFYLNNVSSNDIDIVIKKAAEYKILKLTKVKNSYWFIESTESYRRVLHLNNIRIEFYISDNKSFCKIPKIKIQNKYYIEDITYRIEKLELFVNTKIVGKKHKKKHLEKLEAYKIFLSQPLDTADR